MPIVVELTGNPGSTLDLDRLWLNDAAQPEDLMSFRTHRFTPAVQQPGEVRRLAGGRLRLVARTGAARSETVEIRRPTAEQFAWLEDHLGRAVVIRDPAGGKFTGVYLDLSWDRPVEGADLTINLMQVTHTEAV